MDFSSQIKKLATTTEAALDQCVANTQIKRFSDYRLDNIISNLRLRVGDCAYISDYSDSESEECENFNYDDPTCAKFNKLQTETNNNEINCYASRTRKSNVKRRNLVKSAQHTDTSTTKISIGKNHTMIRRSVFLNLSLNYRKAVRQLLREVFGRETLANYCITGRPSNGKLFYYLQLITFRVE